MAKLTVLYWRDIPAQLIAAEGRKKAKRQLSDRFQKAIDSAAMRAGAQATDDYLNDWRKGQPVPCGPDMEAEVAAAAARIDADYDKARLDRLIANMGREAD